MDYSKPYKSILYDACLTFIPNFNNRVPDVYTRVYIIGGYNGEVSSSAIEYYDFDENNDFYLKSIPSKYSIKKHGCTGYITDDQLRTIIIIGGYIADLVRINSSARIYLYGTQPIFAGRVQQGANVQLRPGHLEHFGPLS